jgi:HSP20 family molecular chaperone IbpA
MLLQATPKEAAMKFRRKCKPQAEQRLALLTPCNPESLRWEMQQVQLAIARRAYELFETRGREHGHDWEDWFQAESELLRPVSVAMAESEDWISVRANVLGFEENELKVGVEPRRILILGIKEMNVTQAEGEQLGYVDWYPDQILQVVKLANEVSPEGALIELQAGLLKFELPKTDKGAGTADKAA